MRFRRGENYLWLKAERSESRIFQPFLESLSRGRPNWRILLSASLCAIRPAQLANSGKIGDRQSPKAIFEKEAVRRA